MIDIHTHILPGIDDGSQSAETSLAMLDRMKTQGLDAAVATPHFYAGSMNPESFFRYRDEAISILKDAAELPFELIPGAEVQYYEGITQMDSLREFRIRGTELLLLEMPFMPWSRRILESLEELRTTPGIRVVLAHIERYISMQPGNIWEELASNGILLQCNAEFFANIRTRHRAVQMFKKGLVHILGSDCHNNDDRPPNVAEGFQCIRRRMGEDAVEYLECSERMLFGKEDKK